MCVREPNVLFISDLFIKLAFLMSCLCFFYFPAVPPFLSFFGVTHATDEAHVFYFVPLLIHTKTHLTMRGTMVVNTYETATPSHLLHSLFVVLT